MRQSTVRRVRLGINRVICIAAIYFRYSPKLGRLTSRRRLRLCVFNEQQTEEIVWAGR